MADISVIKLPNNESFNLKDAQAVHGPSSATGNDVVIFDGTTGKLVKDSGFTIDKSVPSNAVFTDEKVTNTLATTTKYYVTGTTSNATNTGGQSFDSGIYATTTAGQLNATSYKVNEQCTLQWNATTESLDFIFT